MKRHPFSLLSLLCTVSLPLLAQFDANFFNSVDLDGRGSGNDAFKINDGGSTGVDDVGDIFVYENIGSDGGTFYDMTLEITGLRGSLDGIRANTSGNSLVIRLDPPGSGTAQEQDNPFVTFRLSVFEGDADYGNVNAVGDLGTSATISNLTFQVFDIDSQGGINFTDIFGYQTSTSAPDNLQLSAGTELENDGWLALAPSGFTPYRVSPPSPDDWSTVDNIASTSPLPDNAGDYAVNFNYSSGFSTGEYVWGITGAGADSTNTRAMFLNASNPTYIVVPEPGSVVLAGLMAFCSLAGVRLLRNGR